MDRDLLIRKNNLEVNKVAAKCLRITILFLISLGMFSVTDYYNYDTPSVIITFAGSIILLLIPSVLVNVMHLEKQWIKYYVIMCILSVALSMFCLIFRYPLLRFIFGAVDADVMKISQTYFLFTLLSFPFIGLYDAGASIMRSQNNSKNPMIISVISNFMNIAGNSILIFGFSMGVGGAAISTLISRIFCAVVVICQFRRISDPICI